MGSDLQQLLIAVGQAVQEAQQALERQAITQFFSDFTMREAAPEAAEAADALWQAKTERLHIGGRELEVPLAALRSYFNLNLEEVKITIPAQLHLRENLVSVSTAPQAAGGATDDGKIELVFQRASPAEGTARLQQHTIKGI